MNKWEKVKRLRSLEVLGEAPQEASQNLQAPELAPSDKRITGRTKPLSLKAKPEFHRELKKLATEKECLMIEVLEEALEVYKKSMLSKNKPKKPIQLNQFWKVNFICDKCQKKFKKSIVFSPAPSLDYLNDYPTYCVDCKEEKLRRQKINA
ncbi:hypothetical protein [endosymbiont GvMRE of Glomus versiforme]|uniref:hypothetical protein n=1 Tax=endosymbiont GvMRE of Glomus versiforme TaxID=2039283 RepID=UPI000EDB92B4|nr:hypothetical protein [endosymbiont GvMRE of Glomus versiforme]RHZ35719.1 hypothetical protein GvMRE_Ic6g17 [endosymbiont GvMRE of Glomus versiforme]RHZ35721.1 hypothetical protein GvMRE_Ic6g11 [endosymbiont GvMRE of Glomus versiforme]